MPPNGVRLCDCQQTRSVGKHKIGRDIQQRQYYKSAIGDARVRQGQHLAIQRQIIIKQNVDVDRARSPALYALSPALIFDCPYTLKQFMRRK